MTKLISQLTLIPLIVIMFAVSFALPTEARESYFAPAVGEIVGASEFSERAVVTSSGGLALYSYNGDLLPGFPIFATDRVFVTSPVFADVDGSGVDEIVIVSRNSSDAYTLHAFDGAGAELASIAVPGVVFYDPVPIKNGSKDNVFITTEGGEMTEITFSGSFSANQFADVNGLVGITVLSPIKIVTSMTGFDEAFIYEKSLGVWSHTEDFYAPLIKQPWLFDGANTLYGVNEYSIISMDISTSPATPGFTTPLEKPPVGAPFFANVDETDENAEIVVNLSDGVRAVYDEAGTLLSTSLTSKSFLETSIDTAEPLETGVFGTIGNFALGIYRDAVDSIVSIFSNNEFADPINPPVPDPGPGSTLPPGATIYEDAEDGLTLGWSVYDNNPTGAGFANVYLDETHGNVIQTSGSGGANGYLLKLEDGSDWGNKTQKNIHWEMNMSSNFVVYIRVNTTKGWHFLTYTRYDIADIENSPYVHVAIGPELNEWRTFERDLQADLSASKPGTYITSVERLYLRGTGFIDNVALFDTQDTSSISGTVLDTSGSPVENAVVDLFPSGLSTKTDLSGNYQITGVLAKNYELTVSGSDFVLDTPAVSVDLTVSDAIQDFTVLRITSTIYEDAEDSNVSGWTVYGDAGVATITNVYEDEVRGNVIQLESPNGFADAYILKEGIRGFNNTTQPILHFDMNAEHSNVSVVVYTNKGRRTIGYLPFDHISPSIYVQHININKRPGGWRSVTRDLQADLKLLDPELKLVYVESIGFRGNGKVDNIWLSDGVPDRTISGTVLDEADIPIVDGLVRISTLGLEAKVNLNGDYTFINAPRGIHDITLSQNGYMFNEPFVRVDTVDSDATADFIGYQVTTTVYEDAEDGDTLGWSVYDTDPAGASFEIVNVGGYYGNVMKLNSDGTKNGFKLLDEDGTLLRNTDQFLVSWDMNFTGAYLIYIRVRTNNGTKWIHYSPWEIVNTPGGNFQVGTGYYPNQWIRVERDMQADADLYQPGTIIEEVYDIWIRGNGMMDNIALSSRL